MSSVSILARHFARVVSDPQCELKRVSSLMVILTALCAATHARASDGCTVLLCLAGNWRSIGACVPPVRKALRDLALGRALTSCALASPPSMSLGAPAEPLHGAAPAMAAATPGTAVPEVRTRWSDADFCPIQYRTSIEQESTTLRLCTFTGAVEVYIEGRLWNRTWWNLDGDSVTEWTAAARAAAPSTQADTRFDEDLRAWKAAQGNPAPAPEVSDGGA